MPEQDGLVVALAAGDLAGDDLAELAVQGRLAQLAGLDVGLKAERFSRYVRTLRSELNQLAWASGYAHPSLFTGEDIEFSTGVNQFTSLAEVLGYAADRPPALPTDWSALET